MELAVDNSWKFAPLDTADYVWCAEIVSKASHLSLIGASHTASFAITQKLGREHRAYTRLC